MKNISLITAAIKNCAVKLETAIIKTVEQLNEEETDRILDNRDAQPFDGDWVKADKALEEHKKQYAQKETDALMAFSDKVRKRIYMSVIKTTGSPDLAAYVSDDAELIIGALATDYQNTFIYSLANAYITAHVPDNTMQMVNTNVLSTSL